MKIQTSTNEPYEVIANALYVKGVGGYDGSNAGGSGIKDLATVISGKLDSTAISEWAKASTKPSYTFSEIGSKPTTIAGYGITDAKIQNGVITLGSNTFAPVAVVWLTASEYDALTTKDEKTLYVVSEMPTTFGGLQIAPGNLAYENGEFVIKDDWNHDSFDSVYGKNNGSTYFSFIEMGKLFEKSNFSGSDGSITNELNPFDGWRLPSKSEFESFIGSSRAGSTVNNVQNVRYALIQLTGVSHAGSSIPSGLLLFPDGKTMTGKTLANVNGVKPFANSPEYTAGFTNAELSAYIEQGCVFLPGSQYRDGSGWSYTSPSTTGTYWFSTDDGTQYFGYQLYFYANEDDGGKLMTNWSGYKDSCYCPVRLIKEATSSIKYYIGSSQVSNETDYVPLSGGTMTGQLQVPSLRINGLMTDYIELSSLSGTLYVGAGALARPVLDTENYTSYVYSKSQVYQKSETYTKAEVDSLVNVIDEVTAAALVDLDERLTDGLDGIETLLAQI